MAACAHVFCRQCIAMQAWGHCAVPTYYIYHHVRAAACSETGWVAVCLHLRHRCCAILLHGSWAEAVFHALSQGQSLRAGAAPPSTVETPRFQTINLDPKIQSPVRAGGRARRGGRVRAELRVPGLPAAAGRGAGLLRGRAARQPARRARRARVSCFLNPDQTLIHVTHWGGTSFTCARAPGCAGAPAGAKAGPAAPGRAHGDAGSGAQNGAVKGEAAEGPLPPWQSSAKIEFLLRLLNELRDRNAAAALQCAP